MSTQVVAVIEPDGTVRLEVNGVCGPSCQTYTDAVAAALGGGVVSDEKKPEFYQSEVTADKVQGSW